MPHIKLPSLLRTSVTHLVHAGLLGTALLLVGCGGDRPHARPPSGSTPPLAAASAPSPRAPAPGRAHDGVTALVAALEAGDPEAIAATFSGNALLARPFGPDIAGRDRIAAYWEGVFALCSAHPFSALERADAAVVETYFHCTPPPGTAVHEFGVALSMSIGETTFSHARLFLEFLGPVSRRDTPFEREVEEPSSLTRNRAGASLDELATLRVGMSRLSSLEDHYAAMKESLGWAPYDIWATRTCVVVVAEATGPARSEKGAHVDIRCDRPADPSSARSRNRRYFAGVPYKFDPFAERTYDEERR